MSSGLVLYGEVVLPHLLLAVVFAVLVLAAEQLIPTVVALADRLLFVDLIVAVAVVRIAAGRSIAFPENIFVGLVIPFAVGVIAAVAVTHDSFAVREQLLQRIGLIDLEIDRPRTEFATSHAM